MAFAAPTAELKHVAPDALLEYLRGAVSRLASSPSLAQRLGLATADVERAIKSTFEELCAAESRNGSSSHKLVFRHDCQNLTCLNPRCPLCCQNPNKRCPDSVHFASKYLEKNPLRSRCGANIRIEVVDTATGELAHHTSLQGVVLEVRFLSILTSFKRTSVQPNFTAYCVTVQLSMVDGKKYGSLVETGEDVASCQLFLTPKGKALLNPGRMGTHTAENRVRMPLTARGHAVLGTDFTVQVSSEAMLGGQKAPYKLLVRALDQCTGLEIPSITYVASEDFVVATPRVAKAVKAEIPCVDDLVGKLEDIGEKTKDKLANLAAAAETCGAHDLAFPFPSVTTVGHFRQLVELSNSDPGFNDKLKQYLIPNKAREHVGQAVENDKRLRMWYPEPNNTEGGLLYRSVRARVDLDHPDMLVQHKMKADGSLEPELTPCGQAQGDNKAHMQRLISKAKEDWGAPDHPNWSIRDMDSAQFLDSHLQQGSTTYAPIPENRHLDHGVGLSSGGSSNRSHQGSGNLGGSLHLSGLGLTQGSGNLGLEHHSQGSEQFSGQPLGLNPSGSGGPGWQGSGGQGQYGSPHLGAGGGLSQADDPFAMPHEQLFQNTGSSQYRPSNQPPASSSGFGGFPPPPSTSPFHNFNVQQTTMADIFPAAAQLATSQPGSASIGHWGSGSGAGSGSLPHQFSDHGRGLQEVRNNLSSPESPSMNNTPFGSSMGPSSRGPPGRSSAFSQSSAPPHATNGHHFDSTTSPADSTAARPSELDRIDSGFTEPGAKRMRPPLQQQSGSNSSAYHHPPAEIALQQQMLKQRHSGGSSPLGSGNPFGGLAQQGSNASRLQMQPQTAGSGGMQAGQQQQAPAQQPHAQLGNSDLQKNLLDQGLSSEDNYLGTPYLLSENSMHFIAPTEPQPHESHHGRPPPNPTNSPSPLHNYLAGGDSRPEPLRNHVRFSPMPSEQDWRAPHTSTNSRPGSPIQVDLDPRSSSEDLIANANPNLNGIDPARAKWSLKDRWSSGNIFSSFSSSQRKQLGASGKSDGLESMRDMEEFLPDLEDMDADHPNVPGGL